MRRSRKGNEKGGRETGEAKDSGEGINQWSIPVEGRTKRKKTEHSPRIIGAHLKTNVCDAQRLMIQGNETTNPGESPAERRGGEGDGGAKTKVDCKTRQPAKTTG
jgi:hypothetical protein